MEPSKPNWACYTFREHLKQIDYWIDRFELSREIDHLDTAERNAEVVRLYLPSCFQELSLIGLKNIYWSLSAKQASSKNKDTLS